MITPETEKLMIAAVQMAAWARCVQSQLMATNDVWRVVDELKNSDAVQMMECADQALHSQIVGMWREYERCKRLVVTALKEYES